MLLKISLTHCDFERHTRKELLTPVPRHESHGSDTTFIWHTRTIGDGYVTKNYQRVASSIARLWCADIMM
jgi:hypothetical protein